MMAAQSSKEAGLWTPHKSQYARFWLVWRWTMCDHPTRVKKFSLDSTGVIDNWQGVG